MALRFVYADARQLTLDLSPGKQAPGVLPQRPGRLRDAKHKGALKRPARPTALADQAFDQRLAALLVLGALFRSQDRECKHRTIGDLIVAFREKDPFDAGASRKDLLDLIARTLLDRFIFDIGRADLRTAC